MNQKNMKKFIEEKLPITRLIELPDMGTVRAELMHEMNGVNDEALENWTFRAVVDGWWFEFDSETAIEQDDDRPVKEQITAFIAGCGVGCLEVGHLPFYAFYKSVNRENLEFYFHDGNEADLEAVESALSFHERLWDWLQFLGVPVVWTHDQGQGCELGGRGMAFFGEGLGEHEGSPAESLVMDALELWESYLVALGEAQRG